MRIAIVGGGISGLLAARLLSARHETALFEAGAYSGGHTCTLDVDAYGGHYTIDVGFMVYNRRTYPGFSRLLDLLRVPSRASDMSFSVRCDATGLEYQGSSLDGLFAQRWNLLRPAFHRLWIDVLRFNRLARLLLDEQDDQLTLGEFLDRGRFSRPFRDYYLLPMGSAIWSARPSGLLDFPARFFAAFFHNHGLLQLRERPQWLTVVGGARRYVVALTAPFADRIRLNHPVTRVERRPEGVVVHSKSSPRETFDAIVLATHADQTLRLLADATPAERAVLGAFSYQANEAIVHTDAALLPRRRRAWASWNYHRRHDADAPAAVTYHLNQLQGIAAPGPICVTLNNTAAIDPARVLRRIEFHHPVFDRGAIAAQRRWDEINGRDRTYFCGAYWGNGFHEDGVRSALAVGERFGFTLDSCIAASTKAASDIPGDVRSGTTSAIACT